MQNLLKRILCIANRALDYILLMIMLLMSSLGFYFLLDAGTTYTGAQARVYRQYKPSVKEDSSYKELLRKNSDVKAWLTINNTGIDYPVVQGSDNQHYLNHNAEDNYATEGSIFIDSRCSSDFSDFNTIIYGHHMAYGAMFGNLDKYVKEPYFDKHEWGSIYYNGKENSIRFYAFIDSADGYDTNIYSYAINDTVDKTNYLRYLAEHAKYYRDIGVTPEDRIVLLSTCSHTMTNGRYILIGAFRDNESESNNETNGMIDISIWRTRIIRILWILVILLAATLFVIIKKKKKIRKSENKIG